MGRTKRTRKAPLVPTEKKLSSASHKVTQSTISTFHTLLKRRKGIERQLKSSASSEQHQALEKELKNIDRQADEIGGLEAYQQASTLGRMLRLCRAHLLPQPSSMLFIVLPFPCVSNSRYTTAESFKQLVTALGFKLEREQWRPHGKVAYWLFRWCSTTDDVSQFKKKRILNDGPTRNNFTILVE
ncbi:hypothetical protein CcaverHIS641_0405480 [Cutaneotrichosporon cavernicola]|nr:hypothetical protein CcaverHIS641_0405480 [Cutaneotrichosporon cavernicola]